jgi:hypothetical protein
MTRFTFAVLIGGLLPVLCLAESRSPPEADGGTRPVHVAGKFFYTVPEAVQDEWAYAMPECSVISAPTRLGLQNCIAFEKHQMCESSKSVELTNVLSNEKRKFMLLHHLFSTKKACVKSRQETLKGH